MNWSITEGSSNYRLHYLIKELNIYMYSRSFKLESINKALKMSISFDSDKKVEKSVNGVPNPVLNHTPHFLLKADTRGISTSTAVTQKVGGIQYTVE